MTEHKQLNNTNVRGQLEKMKKYVYILVGIVWILNGCRNPNHLPEKYESNSLKIERLTGSTFVHTSYLDIPTYGKFPCNGVIFIDNKEAIVFDTPTSDSVAVELIQWIENELKCNIKAIVVSHFHIDCLGGLTEFHNQNIPSYANNTTISLAKKDSVELPKRGYDLINELELGNEKILNQYFGEGHTKDNIVSYIPKEEILFGGCLIKEVGAGKGNLRDANVNEWANTVSRIKQTYPNLKYVVPGHGKVGGIELLDYTIEMFTNE